MTTKKELLDKVKALKSTNKGQIKGALASMTKDQLQAIIDKFGSTEDKPAEEPASAIPPTKKRKELIDRVKHLKTTCQGKIKGAITTMSSEKLQSIIDHFDGKGQSSAIGVKKRRAPKEPTGTTETPSMVMRRKTDKAKKGLQGFRDRRERGGAMLYGGGM